jgi:hypothetical protein
MSAPEDHGPEDRVPVPTNGHHRPLPAETPTGEPAPAADAASAPAADATALAAAAGPAASGSTDPRIVISPTQLAVGFGILAGAVLVLLGRRRGRRG